MRRGGDLSISFLVCSLGALPACAPPRGAAYDAAFAEAARAESAGRFAEAAQGYERAEKVAARTRDRDQARWDAAEMLGRAGAVSEAIDRFSAIAADGASEHQAEATYRVAALEVDHGDANRGWRAMEEVPRRFPSHGVAHVTVRRLVAHADERGQDAASDELRALKRDLKSTELQGLVEFLAARHLERRGDDEAAREAFVRIADRWPYPFGPFFDDALWHASLIDEKLQRYEAAIDDLNRMLRERETTFLMGSYERPMYVPAMLRIGTLYSGRLHDRAKALDAFHRLYTDFVHSTMPDDALWAEARLLRDGGDVRTACDRLATLVREFPDSRYVPCAHEKCPLVGRPPQSVAPFDCHPYLLRTAADKDE